MTRSRTHGGNLRLTRVSVAVPKTLATDLEHPGVRGLHRASILPPDADGARESEGLQQPAGSRVGVGLGGTAPVPAPKRARAPACRRSADQVDLDVMARDLLLVAVGVHRTSTDPGGAGSAHGA